MAKKTTSKKYGTLVLESAKLVPWPNPYPDRDYTVNIDLPEFTCNCPPFFMLELT